MSTGFDFEPWRLCNRTFYGSLRCYFGLNLNHAYAENFRAKALKRYNPAPRPPLVCKACKKLKHIAHYSYISKGIWYTQEDDNNCHQFTTFFNAKLNIMHNSLKVKPKPSWLRVKLPIGKKYAAVRAIVDEHKLHTICTSGNCPNIGECWGVGTATFMILGNICTRSCGFCAVATGRPTSYDIHEPKRVARAIHTMGVKHAVITSVNRDELKDRGTEIWYQTVVETKKMVPLITIETLLPDVKGSWCALERMMSGGQEVVSHNMETVKELYRKVRPQANYARSLEQLRRIKAYGKRAKSGIMLGLGETDEQVYEVMDDLLTNGVDVLTLGQYLQPTKKHLQVVDFVHPDKFSLFKEEGMKRGFAYVESGPLVRSSYHAERHL